MTTPTAVAAPAAPEPTPEPKFALNGKALTREEYDREFAKLAAAARNPKPAEKTEPK